MKKAVWLTMMITLGAATAASGAHLISIDKALKKIYRKATRFESAPVRFSPEQMNELRETARIHFGQAHSPDLVRHTAYQDGAPVGVAFEDTVVGKWGPIHYVVALDMAGKVRQVMVLDYYEIRGKSAAKRRFLKQYRGKGVGDPIRLRKDIDGVSGATITSRSLTDGVRKTVHAHRMFNP